jgi:hypothetical protein
MKAKALCYWICTALIAFIFVSSGGFYVTRVPQVVEGVTHLGFPLHFVTLLGVIFRTNMATCYILALITIFKIKKSYN